MLIGATESTAGGHYKCFQRGKEDACESMQILTKSPRIWRAPQITSKDSSLFIEAQKKSSIKVVVAHAAYLINLASDKKELLQKSISAMVDERERADALKIPFLIFHPGSSSDVNALQRICEAIDTVIEKTPGNNTMLLIENTAGAGNIKGSTFEELRNIYKELSSKKHVGFCFDTCHAFSSGYDLRTKEGYEHTFREFDRIVGLDKLMCFHLNDSMMDLNSHKDRHANIGQGKIGKECFKLLVNDRRFKETPGALETLPDPVKGFLPQVELLKRMRD